GEEAQPFGEHRAGGIEDPHRRHSTYGAGPLRAGTSLAALQLVEESPIAFQHDRRIERVQLPPADVVDARTGNQLERIQLAGDEVDLDVETVRVLMAIDGDDFARRGAHVELFADLTHQRLLRRLACLDLA